MSINAVTYYLLNTIAIYTPFEYRKIRDVYDVCKSFDITIAICDEACEKGIDPMDVLNEKYAENNEEDCRNNPN
jgi:hypothetical protein